MSWESPLLLILKQGIAPLYYLIHCCPRGCIHFVYCTLLCRVKAPVGEGISYGNLPFCSCSSRVLDTHWKVGGCIGNPLLNLQVTQGIIHMERGGVQSGCFIALLDMRHPANRMMPPLNRGPHMGILMSCLLNWNSCISAKYAFHILEDM